MFTYGELDAPELKTAEFTYHWLPSVKAHLTRDPLGLSYEQWINDIRSMVRTSDTTSSRAGAYSTEARRYVQAISDFTGWSARKVADELLAVSHTTVNQILKSARQPQIDLFRRIRLVHDAIERLWMVSRRDTVELDRVLTTPNQFGNTAVETLRACNVSQAMLIAQFVRRPRAEGMLSIPTTRAFGVDAERVAFLDED